MEHPFTEEAEAEFRAKEERRSLIRVTAKQLERQLNDLTVREMLDLADEAGPAYNLIAFMKSLRRLHEARK